MTLTSGTRVAAYYAPERDDPLFAAGAEWLGRDPESGAPVPQPAIENIEDYTAAPRRYGFHATLKAPIRVRTGTHWENVLETAEALGRALAPFMLPPLAVRELGGFLALRETAPSMPLQALADLCVAGLDRFRAHPTAEELQRRRTARLSEAEQSMLSAWGYPYAFGTWRFHMTLSRRLTSAERAALEPEAQRHFASALALGRRVTSICLFSQTEPEAPFLLRERIPLRG